MSQRQMLLTSFSPQMWLMVDPEAGLEAGPITETTPFGRIWHTEAKKTKKNKCLNYRLKCLQVKKPRSLCLLSPFRLQPHCSSPEGQIPGLKLHVYSEAAAAAWKVPLAPCFTPQLTDALPRLICEGLSDWKNSCWGFSKLDLCLQLIFSKHLELNISQTRASTRLWIKNIISDI